MCILTTLETSSSVAGWMIAPGVGALYSLHLSGCVTLLNIAAELNSGLSEVVSTSHFKLAMVLISCTSERLLRISQSVFVVVRMGLRVVE
jgi:hypothetical protein